MIIQFSRLRSYQYGIIHLKTLNTKNEGTGFSYEYNLPDAWGICYALYRTYKGSLNNGYILLDMSELSSTTKNIRGRYKFSGSDIDQTKDTLIIAVSKYKKQLSAEIEKFDNGQLVIRNTLQIVKNIKK
ncbi:hypothetical protein [Aquimarina amphilecti]|uniref:hypothetical protein n=1 Tax=Aquimarina amphilecti TaxID=1038014 RepID=UPI0011133B01|nr:hypothetical protein [Aquimarina amphilecti]